MMILLVGGPFHGQKAKGPFKSVLVLEHCNDNYAGKPPPGFFDPTLHKYYWVKLEKAQAVYVHESIINETLAPTPCPVDEV